MDLTEIGWTGKAHGLRGELKLHVQEQYESDLEEANSVLVGEPPVPYFLENLRGGGAIIAKFEGLDSREAVTLLSSKPLWLPTSQVSAPAPEPDTPYDQLVGFLIRAEGYPELGPITNIIDFPQHYLCEVEFGGKPVLIPLHEDLILNIQEHEKVLEMVLPDGLLDLGE